MQNNGVAQALRQADISVRVPLEEVERAGVAESIDNAKQIRAICIRAIDDSTTMIVDLDSYGLDTAWELGYAEGKGKRIIGYNLDIQKSTDPQPVNRRHYSQNFMHGWGDTLVYEDPTALVPFCSGKTVYVCGSFNNAEIARLTKSELERVARKLVIPAKHVSASAALPREYPLRDRESTNRLLASADVVLVVLPRYGMDAAWQIGYAAALGKPMIGLLRRDDKREIVNQSFWDHWMHGWKQKPHHTSLHDLVAFVKVQDDVVLP